MAVLLLLLFRVPRDLQLQPFLVHLLPSTWPPHPSGNMIILSWDYSYGLYLYSFGSSKYCVYDPGLHRWYLIFLFAEPLHHTGDLKMKTVRFSRAGQGPPIGTLPHRPAGIMRAPLYTSQWTASALKKSLPVVARTFGSLIFQTQRL